MRKISFNLLTATRGHLGERLGTHLDERSVKPTVLAACSTVEDARTALKLGVFDLVVAEGELEDGTAEDLLDKAGGTPVIALVDDAAAAVRLLDAGAAECVVRGREGSPEDGEATSEASWPELLAIVIARFARPVAAAPESGGRARREEAGATSLQASGLSGAMPFTRDAEVAARGGASGHPGLPGAEELVELSPDAILLHDAAGCILYANAAAWNLFEIADDPTGSSLSDIADFDHATHARATGALDQSGVWSGEINTTTRRGRQIILRSRWARVEGVAGGAVYTTFTDITEDKQLEARFRQNQRMEGIASLASGLAHDLNNILAPILMGVGILKQHSGESDDNNLLKIIEEGAKRASSIIDQVLTFAQGAEGEHILLQPRYLVKNLLRIIEETFPKDIETHCDLPADLWPVRGDATQIHQVLLNLCVNAREAMSEGGELSFAGRNFEADEAFASMHADARPGPYTVLQVTDNGAGVPPEAVPRVFEPFFTTKDPEGRSGLGLSTAAGIVRSHGGFMSFESSQQAGTTVELYLPALPAPSEIAPPAETDEAPRGGGQLILIVDDEQPICHATAQMLEENGYRTLAAHDGTEGLTLFAHHADEIDAVVTDIVMPFMDGVALVRALKKMTPDIRVISSTGHAKKHQISDLEALGVEDFLAKPYEAEQLLHLLDRRLREPGRGGAQTHLETGDGAGGNGAHTDAGTADNGAGALTAAAAAADPGIGDLP